MQEALKLFNDFIYRLHLRPDVVELKVISVPKKKGIIVVAFCCLVGRDHDSNETDSIRYNASFPSTQRLLNNQIVLSRRSSLPL
jgi:hypothetical protein